jgi:hypothetical protein
MVRQGILVACAVLLAGCSDEPTPSPGEPARLHLVASNQSMDDAVIDVVLTIDGKTVLEGECRHGTVGGGMTGEVDLAPGTHILEARELGSGAKTVHSLEISSGTPVGLHMDYWTFPDRAPFFTFAPFDP